MSYVEMDHAGWVEKNNAASRAMRKARKDQRPGIGPHGAPEKLSPFQATVMNIMGMYGGGIYNTPILWDKVDYTCGGVGVAVPMRHAHPATHDYNDLTRLVFMCHEARIRLEIQPYAMKGMRFVFHQRSHEGGYTRRHPDLDEAVKEFRAYLPADHSIVYKMPATPKASDESLLR